MGAFGRTEFLCYCKTFLWCHLVRYAQGFCHDFHFYHLASVHSSAYSKRSAEYSGFRNNSDPFTFSSLGAVDLKWKKKHS